MKIGVFQMEVVTAEPFQNLEKVRHILRTNDCQIYVLPELWSTGFCNKQFAELAPVCDEIEEQIAELSRQHNCTIIGSMLKKSPAGIHNHLSSYNRGVKELEYNKIHLFTLLREERYLIGGNSRGLAHSPDNGIYGAGICYDLRFPEMFRALAVDKAAMIFLPSQWPMERLDHFRTLCIARAIENQAFFISCNNVGRLHEKMQFAGHSLVVDPWGKVLAEGSGEQEELLVCLVDPAKSDEVRQMIPVFRDRKPELYQ